MLSVSNITTYHHALAESYSEGVRGSHLILVNDIIRFHLTVSANMTERWFCIPELHLGWLISGVVGLQSLETIEPASIGT